MALKLSVDSVDGLEESVRGLYTEKDGKFVLNVEGLEDTSGLKTALQKERRERGELEKKVKRWEGLGKTDEEITALIAKHDETAQTEAERKGEWDKLRTQMNDKHAKDLQAKDEKISAYQKRLNAELVDARATSAIAAAKGVPDLLLPHVQRQVKVDEEFNVIVVDAKGDPRVNGKGEPLSITDLIEEMKANDVYGRAFEGSGHSGSGMRPNNGGGGPAGRITKADLKDRTARAKFVDDHGVAAYSALPEK